jgi:hypothetical protein
MKKLSIILIVCGVVLAASSVALLGYNGINWWSDVRQAEFYNLAAKSQTITHEHINRIVIHSSDDYIKVLPSDDNQLKIDYYESSYVKFHISSIGEELSIKQNRTSRAAFGVLGLLQLDRALANQTLTVYVPTDKELTYSMKTSDGDIGVSKIKGTALEAISSSGEIIFGDIDMTGDITAITSNNYINFNDVSTANALHIITSNGRIDITDSNAAQVSAKTSNAPIQLNAIAADDIDLATSNSAIISQLIGQQDDYRKNLQTSATEFITIDQAQYPSRLITEQGDNSLNAKTSNAQIEISFDQP